jgi:hypothetical protein
MLVSAWWLIAAFFAGAMLSQFGMIMFALAKDADKHRTDALRRARLLREYEAAMSPREQLDLTGDDRKPNAPGKPLRLVR